MKTNRYTLAAVLLVTAFLTFSGDLLAQRGHYGNRGRGNYSDHGYRGYSGGYRGYSGYGRYTPVRYYPRYSPVRFYPQRSYYYNYPYVSVAFGGLSYRYQGGYFYRPFGASFQLVFPPFGIRIGALPFGYQSFYVGPVPYYYYGGIYYRDYPGNGYEVVKPPLGAVVSQLPAGAKVTVIDGNKYYELNGTFYEETITPAGDLQYTVVGTDGVLNTDRTMSNDNGNNSGNNNGNNNNSTTNDKPAGPAIGDRFDDLPANSKAVVIKGEKLYLSPSGTYYKEVVEGSKVVYEVVGK
jgi:hypothetical protein